MKLSDIVGMSRRQIRDLSSDVKRDLYSKLRRSISRRGKTFENKGLKQQLPQSYRSLPVPSQASDTVITAALSTAGTYLSAPIYTARGFEKWESEQKSTLSERMGLDRPLTQAEYSQYRQFMNDMSSKMSGSWQYVSDQVQQLFGEAIRLNLNPNQFKRNFDYWTSHVKELAKAKPITRPSGVKPSDYIKQLKLESVTSWKMKS